MKTDSIYIPSGIPSLKPQLAYRMAKPSKTVTARLIILHGYGDHAGRHAHVMQWFAEHGIACYALDFRGHGLSAGKPCAILKWDEYLDDLRAFLAIDELKPGDTPVFVLGHSHGGLIAAVAAMRGLLNQTAGIILVAPYLSLKMPVPMHKQILAAVASRLHPTVAIKSGLNGPMLTRDQEMIEQGNNDPFCRGIATPRWFTETVKIQTQTRANAKQFKSPLLLLLPGDDTVADTAASGAFFNECSSNDKTQIAYPHNRHELLRDLDREQAFTDILHWIQSRTR